MLRIVCPELLLARSGGVFSCFAKRRVASRNSTATGRFIHVESLHPVGIACQAVGHIDDVAFDRFRGRRNNVRNVHRITVLQGKL